MSWFNRLKEGLKKSSNKLSEGLTKIIRHRKLDDEMLEELEELLISADLGVKTAAQLTASLAKTKFDKEVSDEEVKEYLAEQVEQILMPSAAELVLMKRPERPQVVLVVGVNGSGKTTTIGKLAALWAEQGLKVSVVAGDTFRAAAVEQLKIWAERAKVNFIAKHSGADAAGLVFEALEISSARQDDVVLIDTAGRLHNKTDLMAELEKIQRVIQKNDPTAPHHVLLVLDATIGQNAFAQVEAFKACTPLSGLVVTKLDGTAKGGVVVGLAGTFGLPIHAIGVGESVEDLRPFSAQAFAKVLLGIDSHYE